MRKKNGVCWDVLLLTFFLFLWSVSLVTNLEGSTNQLETSDIGNTENGNRIAGTPHSPIAIDGDNNFSLTDLAEGWAGDGSKDQPYIIEGLDIDLGGGSGYCIFINNTRAHFIILNCHLFGASAGGAHGIYLNNVTNARIVDNVINNNYFGMWLWSTNSTSIVNNTFTDNIYGLWAYDSNYSSAVENSLTLNFGCGLYFQNSHFLTVIDNQCNSSIYSIEISQGSSIVVSNNTCFGTGNPNFNGIRLSQIEFATVTNNNCSNVNYGIDVSGVTSGNVSNNTCLVFGVGISVHAYESTNITDNTCRGLGPSTGLQLSFLNPTRVVNNTCIDNYYGIQIGGGWNSTIEDNACYNNTFYGIYLQNSYFNMISNNDCSGNDEAGIYLQNSENNTLINNNCSINPLNGILLYMSNSTSLIENTCTGNSHGIHTDESYNCSIINNICTFNTLSGINLDTSIFNLITNNLCNGNDIGIQLGGSPTNTLLENTCNSNQDKGIQISSSDECYLFNNTCSDNLNYGIYLSNSWDITVSNNTCIRSDFGLYLGSIDTTVSNNTFLECGLFLYPMYFLFGSQWITDNTVNYKPLVFLEGQTGGTIASDAGQIILVNCHDMYIEHRNLSSCTAGLILINNGMTYVRDNTFSNSYYGVYALGVQDVFIERNVFSQNSYGFYLTDFDGVPTFGWAEWNLFFDNHIANAEDAYIPSFFDFDYNYWSDYTGPDDNSDGFGDIPYTFTGNSDPHPLMYNPIPPLWQEPLVDQIVEYDFSMMLFQYDLNITSPAPMNWALNTTLFLIDSDGVISLDSYLPIGTYGLEVTVSSPYGHQLVDSFQIFIADITAPSWVSLPTNQSLLYGEQMDIEVSIVDLSGISRWELNDTINFRLRATYFETTSIARITSSTNLDPGMYWLMVTGFDIYNNGISTVFAVTVDLETTAPVWVLAPIDEVVEYGEPYVQRLGAWDASGIDYWWLNDTVRFVIDEYGVIRNNTMLLSGVYTLNVTVYDPSENSLSAIFTVTVSPPEQDTTPPTWVTLRIYQTIDYGEALQVQVEAWDESGIDHWWLNDTIHFTLDELGVIRNATTLDPGTYRLEVRVYDPFDNYCSATLVVTVLEAPTTTITTTTTTSTTTTATTTTTTSTNTSTTTEGVNPVMTLVLGTGIGGAAVIVVVVVFLRKKS